MLTPEQIQKLAEEIYNNEFYPTGTDFIKKEAFIKGYTTCQNTELAELNKELERVKGLLENSIKSHMLDNGKINWQSFKQQHNL